MANAIRLTVADLRDLISSGIAETIVLRRHSLEEMGELHYRIDSDEPTEDEVSDFIGLNPLFDPEVLEELLDPGLLGYSAKSIEVEEEWLTKFKGQIHDWAHTKTWAAGDHLFDYPGPAPRRRAAESHLWTPAESSHPIWISTAPAALLLANDLLRSGRLLSEMSWRQFEELIGALLETSGWSVEVTRGSKDGGIDVIATKLDADVGEIRALWQAKKRGATNKVELSEVRELSAVRDDAKATKGVIVTTSHLTRGALDWIKRDVYRLSYKDKEQVENWIRGAVLGHPKK